MTDLLAEKTVQNPILSRKWATSFTLAAAAFVLLTAGAAWFGDAVDAIGFPFGLDYGEGIVWEQSRLIMFGQGYGPIDGFPAIVFHYPPMYHFSVAILAELTGGDQLAVGRLLSVSATIIACGFVALVVQYITRAEVDKISSWTCAILAGVMPLSFAPILSFTMLMRVDMLAHALSLAGIYCGLRAVSNSRFVFVAAFFFVAAVYTKQTSIAAPAATFLVLLLVRPRVAWAGIATCMVAGLILMGLLTWSTNGQFLRHIILYNVNRLNPDHVRLLGFVLGMTSIYWAVAWLTAFRRVRHRLPNYLPFTGMSDLRCRLLNSPIDAGFLIILLYSLFATIMLTSYLKSGASSNYFIEWSFTIAILVGIALSDSVATVTGVGNGERSTAWLPLLIAFQALVLHPLFANGEKHSLNSARRGELNKLTEMVAISKRPVISDDMVLLIRAGKTVQWEPAIFAELAHTGLWDERPFVARIRACEFEFFITEGGPKLFAQRYSPHVAQAIATRYPRKQRLAGHHLHFPTASSCRGKGIANLDAAR